MIKGTLGQDLQKTGISLMPGWMKAKMKSQNIGILEGAGQNLLKGSIALKINLVKIEIRNQNIEIEGVQGQYHLKVSWRKEALHPVLIWMRGILN